MLWVAVWVAICPGLGSYAWPWSQQVGSGGVLRAVPPLAENLLASVAGAVITLITRCLTGLGNFAKVEIVRGVHCQTDSVFSTFFPVAQPFVYELVKHG